ncbi:MAG: PP2C family protein-serine/threonine phosphatase [Planctomycetaceae bacterium]
MAFWEELDPATREALEALGGRERYRAGETLVREGEPGVDMFVLLAGSCDVHVGGEVVSRIPPGDLFGEIGSLGGGVRTATVLAREAVEVLRLPSPGLRELLARSRELLAACVRRLAERAREISAREELAQRERRDLRQVQERLLPQPGTVPGCPRLRIDVLWRPYGFASGDTCDVVPLSGRRFLFAVGDVMGHGAGAVPTASILRALTRDSSTRSLAPSRLLAALDDRLLQHAPANIHATLLLLELNGATLEARASGAGHPAPILLRGGVATSLALPPGIPLGYGLAETIPHRELATRFEIGDRVLLYTDGLSEALAATGEGRVGEEGLAARFAEASRASAGDPLPSLFHAVDGPKEARRVRDDATAVLLTIA